MTDLLIPHVQVFAAGDFYDLEQLQEAAFFRISEIMEDEWSPERFPELVAEVFQSTVDRHIRKKICDKAVEHIDELLERVEFSSLLGDFTTSLVKTMKADSDEYFRWYRSSEEHLETARAHTTYMSEKYSSMNRNATRMATRTREMTHCENCDAEYNYRIRKANTQPAPSFRIRCKQCNSEV